jgi:hypothetical protein
MILHFTFFLTAALVAVLKVVLLVLQKITLAILVHSSKWHQDCDMSYEQIVILSSCCLLLVKWEIPCMKMLQGMSLVSS